MFRDAIFVMLNGKEQIKGALKGPQECWQKFEIIAVCCASYYTYVK